MFSDVGEVLVKMLFMTLSIKVRFHRFNYMVLVVLADELVKRVSRSECPLAGLSEGFLTNCGLVVLQQAWQGRERREAIQARVT